MSPTANDARVRDATKYNAAADVYDDPANSFWERFGRKTVERLQLRSGASVLDVCCGSGASALPAAAIVGPSEFVLGVDVLRQDQSGRAHDGSRGQGGRESCRSRESLLLVGSCLVKSSGLGTALLLVAAFLLLLVLWVWVSLIWTYSEGERAGYVQKLSSKGWLCKTWEGEIAMVTMPGAIPEKFPFTVRDDAVAGKINDLAGKRVALSYQQHKFIPSSCFGETEYFVSAVREVVDRPSGLQLPAVPQGQLLLPR